MEEAGLHVNTSCPRRQTSNVSHVSAPPEFTAISGRAMLVSRPLALLAVADSLLFLHEVCFPPPLQMWKISEFTKKKVGEKIRELNDLSPPELTPILTHTDTQTEGNHSTPPCVYIRNVLHTQKTVLCRIFSSEVMVEAADSQLAEFLLFVYPAHLMLFFSPPWPWSNCTFIYPDFRAKLCLM